MTIDSALEFVAHDLSITIDELVADMLYEPDFQDRKKLFEEYQRLDRLRHLYLEAIKERWTEFPFDWKKAEKLGWLAPRDYTWFKEYLV